MHRYIAVIWDSASQSEANTAQPLAKSLHSRLPDWEFAAEQPGLLVAHTGARPGTSVAYTLSDQGGVVLGKLFHRNGMDEDPSEDIVFDSARSREIVQSDGLRLIDNYWGRYVAFISNSQSGKSFVLRDPSGGVLCFKTTIKNICVYFSHFADLISLGDLHFNINWSYLLSDFLEVEILNGKTGLVEVEEVLTGERHELYEGTCNRRLVWDPRAICQTDIIRDFDEAVRSLRSTTQYCVNAWAGTYGSIIHNLSGGLDSAIVLSCLIRAPSSPQIVCLNNYTSAEDGDERSFARLAASKAGLELVELEMAATADLDALVAGIPVMQSPSLALFAGHIDDGQISVARRYGAEAFTTGEGGDHIYYHFKQKLIASDYVALNGVDSKVFSIVLETARLTRASFWAILRDTLVYGCLQKSWNPQEAYRLLSPVFLADGALDEVPIDFAYHPWSKDVQRIPKGKLSQIYFLPKVLHRHPAFGRSEVADVVHPLFSQPLVEVCLRIPSYLLTAGGRNRGLARIAFASAVPQEILARESKGATGSFVGRLLVDNLSFLRQFLLDGSVARETMIDRNRLESVLSVEALRRHENLRPILKLVATEAWLRKLASSESRIAA